MILRVGEDCTGIRQLKPMGEFICRAGHALYIVDGHPCFTCCSYTYKMMLLSCVCLKVKFGE